MTTRTFKTWRDPYDMGFSPCRPKQITIREGLTVFVGCNGSGKTTLVNCIKQTLEKDHTPVLYYNNLIDGGNHSFGRSLFKNNFSLGAELFCSSEGECITINMGQIFAQGREFLRTGYTEASKEKARWDAFFTENNATKQLTTNERWVLIDGMDSGMSIDNIIEIKDVFHLMLEDAKQQNIPLFIIAVANEYELADKEQCFDVTNGKYLQFSNYEEYKTFITNSRKKKDKRYKK